MVDLLDRITVMLEQESRFYATEDYLAPDFQKRLASLEVAADDLWPPLVGNSSTSTSSSSSSSGINEIWREKICEWSYQVIDHFSFSREVVSISIHYLDRYLATRQVNKKMFQLAAMTTLYIAIKLYEPGRLSMSSMIELSRGYFLVGQMAAMEMSILRSLGWNLHPPTAFCFAKHALFMLPYSSISMDVRHDVLELARFLTELSVIDYFFVSHRQSSVGLAALLFAMDESPAIPEQVREDFLAEMDKVAHLDPDGPPVRDCLDRLRLLYAQGGYSRMVVTPETRAETVSPVCVSYGCVPAHVSAPPPPSNSTSLSSSSSSTSDDASSDHPSIIVTTTSAKTCLLGES